MKSPRLSATLHRFMLLFAITFLTACGALTKVPAPAPPAPVAAPAPAPAPPPAPVAAPAPAPIAAHAPAPAATAAIGAPKYKLLRISPEYGRVVRAFFGTDRTSTVAAKPENRFLNGHGELQYGFVEVSIPPTHKIGVIEAPRWFETKKDANKHIVLNDARTMTKDEFISLLKGAIASSDRQAAFIFVHGYNVSFETAALRTAQIAVDLDLKTVPAFYSWPSQGQVAKYTVDEASIERTQQHLRTFLTTFADESGAKEIYVIAHSMGTRAVTNVLSALLKDRPELQPRFRELILAAPDIDRSVFLEQLLPRLSDAKQQVTLYSSSNDKALLASKKVHGEARAGASGADLVVAPGLETIDASGINTDFLGHSYFAESRALITDMSLLINRGIRAGERPLLDTKKSIDARYWAFRP